MIPLLRTATAEELTQLAPTSDLTGTSSVWVWPNGDKPPDSAVIRECTEIDPIHFGPESSAHRKALFGWVMFNMLKLAGKREVYFDVNATGQEDWIAILEKMGAQKTTAEPQYRFKLELK